MMMSAAMAERGSPNQLRRFMPNALNTSFTGPLKDISSRHNTTMAASEHTTGM